MTTVYEQLQEQVRRVADARREAESTRARLETARSAFEREHGEMISSVLTAQKEVEHAEHALRNLTVAHFQLTGEARPTQGVEVKVFTTLDYEEVQAFAWGREKGMCIKPASLDKKAFERVVAALPERPDFVRFVETPRAQIASDLDKVLGLSAEVLP